MSGPASSCKPGRPSAGAGPSASDSKLSNQVSTIVSLLSTLCRGSPLVTHVGQNTLNEDVFITLLSKKSDQHYMFSFWVSRTCCVQHCPIRWSQRWEEMSAVYWTPCGWLTSCWCSCLRGEKRCQSPQQGRRAGSQGCDVWTVLGRDHTDSSSTVSVARTQMLSSMPLTLEVMMQTNKYYRSHESEC